MVQDALQQPVKPAHGVLVSCKHILHNNIAGVHAHVLTVPASFHRPALQECELRAVHLRLPTGLLLSRVVQGVARLLVAVLVCDSECSSSRGMLAACAMLSAAAAEICLQQPMCNAWVPPSRG